MVSANKTQVIQVTNVAPQATKDQMETLFGYIGKIEEIRLYPTVRDVLCSIQTRICYVKYREASCVAAAQHLTNTVFIDRALIVIPVLAIPEEYRALEMSKNGTIVPGLKNLVSKLPPEVINRIEGQSPQQVIKTYDPKLVYNNLPEYPALPSFYDGRKVEEIRRTIIVCDVKNDWFLNDLMDFFQNAGEVKYARWAEKDNECYCMIEFCEQPSIIRALKLQGQQFKGGYLNIYHSTDNITKPEAKSNKAAQAEIVDAMTIVNKAQNMISAAIDPVIGILTKHKRRRSRSRSRSHKRRTTRSGSHRSLSRRRSRSRTRKRSRSISKRRSRSHSRRSYSRKHSHSRKRSLSRQKYRSRSRSKCRTPSRERRSKRSRSRHRRRSSRSRSIRSRSLERNRSHCTRKEKRSRSHSEQRWISPPTQSHSSRSRNIGPLSMSSSSKRRSRAPESILKSLVDEYEVKSRRRSGVDSKSRKPVSLEIYNSRDISNSP